MQKLEIRNTYTPTNASQVRCNCDLELNKDQSLSVQDLKTVSNSPKVNHQQHIADQNLRVSDIVYVRNLRGVALMPCKQRQSRLLLKQGKAKVIKRFPFTIQLTIATGESKQEVTLGIDTGFGNIGFSAVSDKKELICGTLKLDGRTKDRLEERKMYRRGRRNKLWYRKARWLNRNIPEGWLPPSIQRRYDTHISLINKLKKLLPITQVIIEIAKFDIQKIENSEISGTDYQQGNLYEYQNMRSYLMSREHGKCQFCSKDFKGQSSHIHHIKPRHDGGNNRSDNLALLHEKCHDELHKKHLESRLKSNSKDYKQSTFMSIINKKFWNDVPDLKVTHGNITFVNRNKLRLEKTHYNDAFIIAKGCNQERVKPIEIIQKHRNNRVLQLNRKGFKPSIKKEKSKINPLDLFWISNKKYTCKGMFGKGKYILYGDVKMKEYCKYFDVSKIFRFGSLVWKEQDAIHPVPLGMGILAVA